MVYLKWKAPTVLALLILFLPLTTFAQVKVHLIGTWYTPGPEGPILLIFESSNRLVFDGEPAKYTLAPRVIRVEDEEGVVDYPYVLSGDVLTLVFPGGIHLQFIRAKPGPPSPPTTGKSTPQPPAAENVGSSELVGEISGIWWGYSGSTERKIGLCLQGKYQEYTDSAYSGSSRDSLGNTIMNWGTAGQGGGRHLDHPGELSGRDDFRSVCQRERSPNPVRTVRRERMPPFQRHQAVPDWEV